MYRRGNMLENRRGHSDSSVVVKMAKILYLFRNDNTYYEKVSLAISVNIAFLI